MIVFLDFDFGAFDSSGKACPGYRKLVGAQNPDKLTAAESTKSSSYNDRKCHPDGMLAHHMNIAIILLQY